MLNTAKIEPLSVSEPPAAHLSLVKEMSLSVRFADKSDWADFLKHSKAFFEACPMRDFVEFDEDGYKSFFDNALQNDDMAIWIAKKDGETVGVSAALIFPLYFSPKSRIAQEMLWWLEPEHRGCGLGQMMFSSIKEWAKDRKADHIFMIALENDKSGVMERVYKRDGFTPVERIFSKRISHGN